jgi:WD40 repeat protein
MDSEHTADSDMPGNGDFRALVPKASVPLMAQRGLAHLTSAQDERGWSLQRAIEETASRGVDVVLAELRLASAQSPGADGLAHLLRALDAEAHLVRAGILDHEARLLQNLRNRCFEHGWLDVQAEAESLLRARALPYLGALRPVLAEHPSLIRTLAGHSGGVNGLAVDQRGRWIVSASADQTLGVWSMATGRLLRLLRGHSGVVNCVALSQDGNRAFSASADGAVCMWDVDTGECLGALLGHQGPVHGVALDPGGLWLISAGSDGTVRMWNLSSSRCWRVFEAPRLAECLAVAVLADGQKVAVALGSGHLAI